MDATQPSSRSLVEKVTAWALSLKPVRVWFHYVERRGPMLSDSVTYRALFSVFAAVLLGFSFAALWLSGNPQAWDALVEAVDAAIPGLLQVDGSDGLIDVTTITAPEALTITGILSLLGLVGAAIGAIGSLRAALRTLADDIHDDAFFLWVILRNLLLAVAIGGGFVLSAAVTVYGSTFIETLGDWFDAGSVVADFATQALAIVVVFVLDAGLIALAFVVLSGVKARLGRVITGALIGGAGLIVLQQLSGLFVRGAGSNPLLASFAALIALLLWFNLSAQVILLASTWIIVGVAEDTDGVREKYGTPTFEARRVKRAEDAVRVATRELAAAQTAAAKARTPDDPKDE